MHDPCQRPQVDSWGRSHGSESVHYHHLCDGKRHRESESEYPPRFGSGRKQYESENGYHHFGERPHESENDLAMPREKRKPFEKPMRHDGDLPMEID